LSDVMVVVVSALLTSWLSVSEEPLKFESPE
jgi:hypothetical protein